MVFLTNFVPPYRIPVLIALAARVPGMRVLVSTRMEANRNWDVDWADLDVVVQKTITFNRRWRHPAGFGEPIYVHLPIDTLRQLKQFRAGVVISGEMGLRTVLAAAYRKLYPESKLIVLADVGESTERGRGWIRGVLRRALRRYVDAFIVVGGSGRRYLRDLGVANENIFEVPYATDTGRLKCNGIARTGTNAYSLLYVGQLIERKGLVQFVDALCKWSSANPRRAIEFRLAGDGPLRQALETISVPSNLKLTFLGRVGYGNLAATYVEAGIFVFPSLADSWGVAVNEAMASGLPVLGSIYSQAVEELVEEGRSGWTFHPDDFTDLYRAIDRSMNTPVAVLDEMRENARNKAMHLTPEHVANRIADVIASCLSASGNNTDALS